jgi:hypothetical protein
MNGSSFVGPSVVSHTVLCPEIGAKSSPSTNLAGSNKKGNSQPKNGGVLCPNLEVFLAF